MSPIVREYYRVPRENRQTYIRPAPAELPALVERNRRLIGSWDFQFAGRPFQEFRAAARAEAVALARQYAQRWGFTLGEWSAPAPLILTGHQPPPFHTGVWFKSFLAGSLAAAVGGAALNLVVDNDEVQGQVFRFPRRAKTGQGSQVEEVGVVEVPFAAPLPGMAYEEQASWGVGVDVEAIARRIVVLMQVIKSLRPRSAIDAFNRYTKHVNSAAAHASSLGEALAVGRHWLEEELGLRNLELPVSRLADGEAFRLFVAEMLRRREAFFAAYNDSLAEYRRVYRERSAAQPVPDLARDGASLELPFWIWRAGQPRRRLWVETRPDGALALRADRDLAGLVRADDVADAGAVAACLAHFRREGWKIRPRAISMTLFARLTVADVFIHGVGAALYDKITDAIFERLFGVPAPQLVLASCTVHLPLEAYPAAPRDLEAALRAVRQWRWNPDRMLAPAVCGRDDARALVDEKRRLIARRDPAREGRSAAWRRVRAVNESLAAMEPEGLRQAEENLARVRRQLRYNAVLQNRDYAFFFYPPEELAAFYREALEPLAWASRPRSTS